MTKDNAYSIGYDNGYNAGELCEVGSDDIRQAGCDCRTEEQQVPFCDECLTAAAFESEQNARQFSPFEFTAHDINESEDSEELWERYDEGVAAGIAAAVKGRLS